MIDALWSEVRKVLTVRSTYVILAICFAVLMLFAFYLSGYRTAAPVTNPNHLAEQVTGAVGFLSVFIAFIGVLLMTHEYRYNTILYTIVAGRSRLLVLLAKILVVTVVSVVLTLLFGLLAPLMTSLGLQLKGVEVVPQSIPVLDLLWRGVFYGWAYSMLALLIATVIRNQVGAIAFLFIVPGTVEVLLGLLLKEDAKYLPFNTLTSVLQQMPLDAKQGALLFTGYLIAGWAIAALLFQKRDAN